MKKIILFTFIGLVSFGLSAQNLFLTNYTTNQTGNASQANIDAHVTIENHAATNLNVMAQRVLNNLAPNHLNNFCYGIQCYGPSTSISPGPELIMAGGSDNTFKSTLLTNGSAGISEVKYCFFDQNNNSDSVCVRFVYEVSAVGIEDVAKNASFSKPSPNPAKSFTAFTYDLKNNSQSFKIDVYNMLGSKVKSIAINENRGAIIMSTDELENGIYFCSLVSNSKVYLTQKLLVAR